MKFKLRMPLKKFLLERVLVDEGHEVFRKAVESGTVVFGQWEIDIDPDIAEEIRDLCSDKLSVCGFDENYKPNEQGVVLEDLIDLFYVG